MNESVKVGNRRSEHRRLFTPGLEHEYIYYDEGKLLTHYGGEMNQYMKR